VHDDDEEFLSEEDESQVGEYTEEEQADSLKALPTLDYFEKRYGRSMQNDQKAVKVFRDYESMEKLRRLQNELVYVKEQRVGERTCQFIIGRKRAAKHGSYSHWAQLMLLWIAQKGR
jgi:hypothetical protein